LKITFKNHCVGVWLDGQTDLVLKERTGMLI